MRFPILLICMVFIATDAPTQGYDAAKADDGRDVNDSLQENIREIDSNIHRIRVLDRVIEYADSVNKTIPDEKT